MPNIGKYLGKGECSHITHHTLLVGEEISGDLFELQLGSAKISIT